MAKFAAKKRSTLQKLLNKKFAERMILLIGLLSLAFFINLKDLYLDYRFEKFFPRNDPDFSLYTEHTQTFGTDNDFFIIGITHEEGIFKGNFLARVDELTDSLANIKRITGVTSPTRLKFPVVGPMGVFQVPYLHLNKPELFSKDSARIFSSENLVGSLFSEDGKSISIQLTHEPNPPKAKLDSLVKAVEKTVASYGFDEAHVAGKIKGQYYFTNQLLKELVLFISISIGLVAIFLFFSFRSLWGIWVPILVIGLSVLWMLSIMGFINRPINIMTTLLPTILFVVGISNVVHILERYIYELRLGKKKIDALFISFKEVGFATFLTSFTTAVGFFTLNTIQIIPVREFGTFTAIGVIIAFVLAFTLLPSVLVLVKKPKIVERNKDSLFWTDRLHFLLRKILPNRHLISLFLVLILGIAIWGVSQLKVDNFFVEDWTVNEETKRDYLYFEDNFSGFRPFELAVNVKDTTRSFEEYDLLRELTVIDKGLREVYGSRFLVSPLTFIKTANQSLKGGNPEGYALPKDDKAYKRLKAKFRSFEPEGLRQYLTEDGTKARFSGKVLDVGGRKMNQLNQTFDSLMETKLNTNLITYQLTGMPYLIDKNNYTLSQNILLGLLLAFTVVALLMGLLFRSFPMVFISLIPNILPLALIAGIMGWAGIDLKISTSIIFTIAFGIAVDDTIHFMTKFNLELRKGRSLLYALKRTYLQTGKAIIVTSIILCSGFFLLIFSQVASNFYIGLLISLTLLFAVVSDLLLLPILIIYFYRRKET